MTHGLKRVKQLSWLEIMGLTAATFKNYVELLLDRRYHHFFVVFA